MRIIFVRHGHPNYEDDCLTELGHKQAEAAAQRLKNEKIDRIFSSSCGRAAETAEHIADVHNMKVQLCDFMQEIPWGNLEGQPPLPHNGNPWAVCGEMVANGQSITSENWAEEEPFCKNKIVLNVRRVAKDFDQWLSQFGYEREGRHYRVKNGSEETVVMACHGGSCSAVFTHIFNIPLPFVCQSMAFGLTAITVVKLGVKEGTLVSPRFEIVNDVRHTAGIEVENFFGI